MTLLLLFRSTTQQASQSTTVVLNEPRGGGKRQFRPQRLESQFRPYDLPEITLNGFWPVALPTQTIKFILPVAFRGISVFAIPVNLPEQTIKTFIIAARPEITTEATQSVQLKEENIMIYQALPLPAVNKLYAWRVMDEESETIEAFIIAELAELLDD